MGTYDCITIKKLCEKELTLLNQKVDDWDKQVIAGAEEMWMLGDCLALIKVNSVLDIGVEIGWRSFDEGNGYATEAVRQFLESHSGMTVYATIGLHNIASQRVAEKNNFEIFHQTNTDLFYRIWLG